MFFLDTVYPNLSFGRLEEYSEVIIGDAIQKKGLMPKEINSNPPHSIDGIEECDLDDKILICRCSWIFYLPLCSSLTYYFELIFVFIIFRFYFQSYEAYIFNVREIILYKPPLSYKKFPYWWFTDP